jgi:hypothetical protein
VSTRTKFQAKFRTMFFACFKPSAWFTQFKLFSLVFGSWCYIRRLRVARFLLVQTYQKVYQMTTNCTKRSFVIPNGHKLY